MRVILQRPFGLAGIGIAREQRRGPFVVARTLLLVPRARIAGAVIDQVQVRIVSDPSPHRSSSGLPSVARPGRDAEIRAVIGRVERVESGADQHVPVRPGGIGPPQDLAGSDIERRQPAAHAELAARVADQHLSLHDQRRHRDRFAGVDVAQFGLPELLAGLCVQRDRVVVEGVEEELAVRVGRATVDDVTARHTLRRRRRIRPIRPFDRRAGLGEIERKDNVRIWRHNEHCVVRHDRRRFLPVVDAG